MSQGGTPSYAESKNSSQDLQAGGQARISVSGDRLLAYTLPKAVTPQ